VLTFAQFLAESNHDVNEYGFLRPDAPTIKKTGKDRGKWNHLNIAKRHGYKSHQEPIKGKGWVRYDHYHHWQGLEPGVDHQAGYEFRDHPEQKKMVAAHIRKNAPFHKVIFDVHHPDGLKSHEFHSAGEALRHLGESFLLEGPDYYHTSGWIKPDGSYLEAPKNAKYHSDYLPKHLKGKNQDDYTKAFAAGWVRHGQMKYDKSHMFHAGRINQANIKTIDHFMMSPRHHEMGGSKYRLMADNPYREINGHSREHFINALH
jgi:hypothetical protein